MERHRRNFLTLVGTAGLATLAGCSSSSDSETPTGPSHPVLRPTDGDEGDRFGFAVSIANEGTTALVGARTDEDPNGKQAGAAYIFNKDGGTWSQGAKLAATDGDEKDYFGTSVALSTDGRTALIGAPRTESAGGEFAGSAYVFENQGDTWTQQAILHAEDRADHAFFGNDVAISDDGMTALVGAKRNDGGAAYVFTQTEGGWAQQVQLSPASENRGGFGSGVALAENGTTALIGAYFAANADGVQTGSAHIFEATDDTWSQQATLTPENGESNDGFGNAVSLSADGTEALIGAWNAYRGEWTRAAYAFNRSQDEWNQQTKFTPDSDTPEDQFGYDVSLSADGTTAFVGAPPATREQTGKPGEVYVFNAISGGWRQQNVITAGDGDMKDGFGFSVAVGTDKTIGLTGAVGREGPEESSSEETTARTSPTWDYDGELAGAVYVLREF